jgi:hypothetical protein
MRRYQTPPGTYDLPFSWIYDAAGLTTGLSYPNQQVYIQGGYGDFILRRIVGLSLLEPNAGNLAASGAYQIQDRSGNYISNFPIAGGQADDLGICPEMRYPETGQIKFDLGPVTVSTPSAIGQIAFQGARRMKGNYVQNPTYRARARTYTYVMPPAALGALGTYQTIRQVVSNYDFELHQLIILVGGGGVTAASRLFGDDESVIQITAVTPGAAGNSIQIFMDIAGPFAANQPMSVSVVGNVITLNPQTDSSGHVIYNPPGEGTNAQVLAAFAASAPASALVTASLYSGLPTASGFGKIPNGGFLQGGTGGGGGAGFFALQNPISKLWIYDSNKVQISSAPMLDIFCDGGPGGVYQNGAIVPPLWYPQNSQIQIDVYSATSTPGQSILIYCVGKEFFPC